MSIWKAILNNLPEVESPSQKFLAFKEKLKWTLIILVIFFILGVMPLFGLGANQLERFEFFSVILGAEFGSIISLGIGPIVTASIVLQLLNGSGILKLDLTQPEGKKTFQGLQKLLAIFFIIFEAIIFVMMGGLSPEARLIGTAVYSQLQFILIFQLFLGGIMVLFMDEVVSKWGFGSGIGLFIAAGVSKSIFVQAFNWLPSTGGVSATALSGLTYSAGAVPALFQSLAAGDPITAGIMVATLLFTAIIFVMVVFAQAMKVEIPLSFGMVRGHGVRWPLSFFYTSVIPVILVSALIANLQLLGSFLNNRGISILGTFNALGQPSSGFIYWVQPTNLVRQIIQQGSLFIGFEPYLQALFYILFLMFGAMIFSMFWVQTAGMDARSQAKQMMGSGLQIPGFRRDERVLERLLSRYIWPLTIMGGLSVGFLAGFADITGTLSSGTGILLAVMIVFKLYEEISKQHMMDMNPMMRKFMGG
jgi:preprotein translocase subunit SecY